MELINRDVSSIQPDKNQPRHTIDMVRVKEMAKSILTEGVINPIEIDANGIIVTGEMRWRASKEAGLENIPCKVVDYEGRDRFRRQVVENIHHNTMTTMDTAEALDKLLNSNAVGNTTGYGSEDVKRISKEIGKSDQFLYDHLNLLKESPKVREWLRKPESKMSLIREINRIAPDEVKEELKEKVVDGEIKNYRIATELSKALKQAPDKKDELFAQDWSKSKDSDVQTINEIAGVVQPIDDIKTLQGITRAVKYVSELNVFFTEQLPDDFPVTKVAELKVAFSKMVELGQSFFSRNNLLKGE